MPRIVPMSSGSRPILEREFADVLRAAGRDAAPESGDTVHGGAVVRIQSSTMVVTLARGSSFVCFLHRVRLRDLGTSFTPPV